LSAPRVAVFATNCRAAVVVPELSFVTVKVVVPQPLVVTALRTPRVASGIVSFMISFMEKLNDTEVGAVVTGISSINSAWSKAGAGNSGEVVIPAAAILS
jgi:hypothetical protein